jgi:hypothetical protein
MTIETWNIEEITGYHPISTFYEDFSIAEKFGFGAIKDTFNRVKKSWLKAEHYEMVTELAMALNWKCWRWNETNGVWSEFYANAYYEIRDWCHKHLKGDKLSYYLRTTD